MAVATPKTDNPVALELGLLCQDSEYKFNPSDRYSDFIINLYDLIDGNMDPTEFEDRSRAMFSTFAYISFTLDKLSAQIAKQVLNLLSRFPQSSLIPQAWAA